MHPESAIRARGPPPLRVPERAPDGERERPRSPTQGGAHSSPTSVSAVDQTYIGEYAPANACSIRDKVPLTWENGGC